MRHRLNSNELWGVSGFLLGEGCFGYYNVNPRVSATQKELQPLEWLVERIGGRIHKHSRGIYTWNLDGILGIGLMMSLLPIYKVTSPKRFNEILEVIDSWKKHKPRGQYRTHCTSGHSFEEFGYRDKRQRRCKKCIQIYNEVPRAA